MLRAVFVAQCLRYRRNSLESGSCSQESKFCRRSTTVHHERVSADPSEEGEGLVRLVERFSVTDGRVRSERMDNLPPGNRIAFCEGLREG